MYKKCVVLYYGDKPIKMMEIKDYLTANDYIKVKEECERNYNDLINNINDLIVRLEKCEKELAYNRGDVDKL